MATPQRGGPYSQLDSLEQEIIDLISQDDEPRNKAFLLILYRMHQNLVKNTEATVSTASEVKATNGEIIKFQNKYLELRGGWRVILATIGVVAVLLGAIQGLAFYIIQRHLHDTEQLRVKIERMQELFGNHGLHFRAPGE